MLGERSVAELFLDLVDKPRAPKPKEKGPRRITAFGGVTGGEESPHTRSHSHTHTSPTRAGPRTLNAVPAPVF